MKNAIKANFRDRVIEFNPDYGCVPAEPCAIPLRCGEIAV